MHAMRRDNLDPLLGMQSSQEGTARSSRQSALLKFCLVSCGMACAVFMLAASPTSPVGTEELNEAVQLATYDDGSEELTPAVQLATSDDGKSPEFTFLLDMLAGGTAGAIAKTVAAPIERVKLIFQTQEANPKILSGEVERYSGLCNTFYRVYQEQGLASFWRGNLPNVLRYFPVAAFNFAFKDQIEALFPKYDPDTQFLWFFLVVMASGGLAGAGSLTIVYPLDLARTKMAADVGNDKSSKEVGTPVMGRRPTGKRQYNGLCDCLCKTVKNEGFFALYSGYAISVVGIIFYRAPFFGLYDAFHALNPWRYKPGMDTNLYLLSLLANFVLAQVTSAIAGFISYPFDTVRRRLQMESDKHEKQYKGACHCAYLILTKEGVGGMYKGFIANLFRGATTAGMLVIYQEITKRVLHTNPQ
eukprot:TRINITY_DN5575_c0_g1_i1.p1 TRINITY_DN5575_c0_g1~~TRINITY_DN5575_c0_g1_i1.p1  ORF type:complete len:440 (-),score=65.92 TRINITY_DN5575_c0_g1_i1:200-1447(-)